MLLVNNNNNSTQRMEKSKLDSKQVFCEWASAKDPKSGRAYYYNIRTKETIWNKPLVLASSAEEREGMLKKRADTLAFFHEMERNIKIKFTNYQNQNVHPSLSLSSNTYSTNGNVASGHDDDNQNIHFCQHHQQNVQTNQCFDFLSSSSPFLLDNHHYFNTPHNGSANTAATHTPCIYPVSSLDDGMMSETFKRLERVTTTSGKNILDNDYYDFNRKMIEQTRNTFSSSSSSSSSSTSSMTPPLFQAGNREREGEVEIKERVLNFNRLKRRNSTGTIYVGSTMSVQDNDATIKCVCVVIRTHMINTANENIECQPEYDIFKDIPFTTTSSSLSVASHHHSTSYSPDKQMVPSLSTVKDFFNLVFKKSQIENECIIIALIYCERLVRVTKGKLVIRYDNWRSILFACLIMASKVWDDLSMWNVDFSQVSTSFDLQRINALELAILSELKYTIRVSASEYAKYYFHLRYMMAKLGYTSSLCNDLTSNSSNNNNNNTNNNMGYGSSSSYGTANNNSNNNNITTGCLQPLNMMQARKLQIGTEKYARSYETVLQGRRSRSKTVADLNLCDVDVDVDDGCNSSNNNSRGNSVEYDSDKNTSNNNNNNNNGCNSSDERKLKRIFTSEEQSQQQLHQPQQHQEQFSLSRSSSGSSNHSNNTSNTLNNFNIYKRNNSNRSSSSSGGSKTLLCLEQLIHDNHIDADGQEHTAPRRKNKNSNNSNNNVCSDSSSNSIYNK